MSDGCHTYRPAEDGGEFCVRCGERVGEVKRLRGTLRAARDKFAELELPVYAEACDATLCSTSPHECSTRHSDRSP